MNGSHYDSDVLESLMGSKRDDQKVVKFLAMVDEYPEVTIDTEDGANDEFIEFKSLGFGLCFDEGILHQIAIHSGAGDRSYSRYQPDLPSGLEFSMDESSVRNLMGNPMAEGGDTVGFFGPVKRWLKYPLEGRTIHLKFSKDGRLETVTLGLK